MSSTAELADDFHSAWLAAHPFDASYHGIPGYDDRLPDASEAGDANWRARIDTTRSKARGLAAGVSGDADAVTLGCIVALVEQEIEELDSLASEHTVTAMPFRGPAEFFATTARTLLPDRDSAEDYLTRLARSGVWIDQQTERLRIGARKGRLPVAPLVEVAIAWAERVLGARVPEAIATPRPPAGWGGAVAWSERRDALAVEVVRPALGRWVEQLRELLPDSRPGERAGLVYLRGGEGDYERAIRSHTTLPLTAEQLHRTGLEEIAALEERAVQLGTTIGRAGLEAVQDAVRASAGVIAPSEAMDQALHAIRRAEQRLGEALPPPLPEPCTVLPMPPVVASSGTAPHYTPPRLDGTRPGTYWFNTEVPTAGTGWDLESVAFHEAVPGHHVQLARIQQMANLPAMQRQRYVTVFSEGWGLYAEQLAEELDLYSSIEGILGAISAALLRAGRLVVDTGLHAFGWSRQAAVDFLVAHVPLPPAFLAAEVDRYVIWPGQALAYLTGKLEILRARDLARRRLGPTFSLPGFHAALIDSGSLPIPVLHTKIDRWIEASEADAHR